MIRALLVDLDGVLRHWDAQHESAAESAGRLPAGAIRRAAFAHELLHPAITGAVSDEAWRTRIVERLQQVHPECDAVRAVELWSASPGRVDTEVLELVRSAQGQATIALLSNATTRLRADLRRLGIADEFDHIFNSAEMGLIKPQPAVFRAVLQALQLPPEAVLFVDDHAGHVSAAESLGIVGHTYGSRIMLSRVLDEHRLLGKVCG
jgi:putative hydrolase of the HAD superfamily